MPLDGYRLLVVRIDRMVLPFSEKHKAVFLEVRDEVPPLDRHLDLGWDLFEKRAAYGDLFLLLPVGQDHLAKSVL